MPRPDGMHLAEVNIAEAMYDLDAPEMVDFVNNLERINGLAERMPGFVWRLKDETGDATGVDWSGNPRIIVNMSVWETPEQLQDFVFNTAHRKIYARRAEWFSLMKSRHFVMWWVAPGHVPDLAEARAKLAMLDANGPSEDAFGWEHLGLSDEIWRAARCA